MRVLALSRLKAERFTADVPYLMISITDPEAAPVRLPNDPHRLALLWLEFNDLTPEVLVGYQQDELDALGYKLFSKDQAESIARFLFLDLDYDLVVVHCELGINRSVAIANAIAQVFGIERLTHGTPNAYVYRMTLDALTEARYGR